MTKKKADTTPQRPLLMSAAEMAKVSGIGENTLRSLMAEGKLEHLQIGNRRLIAESAIWSYYDQHKTTVTANMAPVIFRLRKNA